MSPRFFAALVVATTLVGAGCSSDSDSSAAAPDAWLGRWTGPEGTFLVLEGSNGRYDVTIANLDGPRVFKGTVAAGRIVFERDGMAETIHATNGADTGMKWLADKKNCLTVRVGEGYCRD